jgi:S1-C subfamily serine protease
MNNPNRTLPALRRLRSFALSGIVVAAQMSPVFSQATADERNTIEAFKRVAPAVVHVKATHLAAADDVDAVAGQGTGSGFLIDQAGHVLTNYHVVGGSSDVKLLLS